MSDRTYWEDRHTKLPAMRAVGSINHSVSYNRWLYRVRGRAFDRAVRELGLQPARVLDIGSGTGFYLERWRRFGVPDVVGSDIAQPAVQALRSAFPALDIRHLDICSPITDLGPFDVVSAFDVLFHIVEDDAYATALANIHRALDPGGTFLFSEHLPRRLISSRSHRVSRTLDQVTELLGRTGFEVALCRPVFRFMYPPLEPDRYRVLDRLWRGWPSRLARSEPAGTVLGSVLYPLEVLAARSKAHGPHTHLVAAQKVG